MRRLLSFRVVRNLGLGILTSLILVASLFAFFMLKRIDDKISSVMEKERPSLNAVLQTQNHFVEIYPHFQEYITGQLDSYQQILRHIEEVKQSLVAVKMDLPPEERVHLQKFGINLKYLKYLLNTYNAEVQYDPASSNTAELSEIVTQKMNEANTSLNTIVGNVRQRIQLVDMEILQGIQRDRQVLFMFLLVAVIMGFAIMVIINWALATPVHQLMEGAKKIGEGNLDWRIKQEHRDEFGQLVASFNTMAEKLYQTQNQLIQAGKLSAIGELAASVSHELNNPLGGILGYSQFILEQANKKGIQHLTTKDIQTYITYIGYIKRESEHCKTIIQNLLSFSRLSKTEFAPVDINQTLEETLTFTQHQLYMHQIELIQQIQQNLPKVMGDKHQLQQVFTNMIINAQQAMKKGGTLTVSTAINNGLLEIAFTDTGCGIPPEYMDKLFDSFFTTKEIGKGTGLGLSVSYGIIKKHSGSILVESKLNEGSTFIIHLPITSSQQSDGDGTSVPTNNYEGKSS